MNLRQANWAAQHDWLDSYVGTPTTDDYVVYVVERGTVRKPDGTVEGYEEAKSFTDYEALRAWAGY